MASSAKEELKGAKFGTLEVIEYAGRIGTRHAWRTRCQCGREKVTVASEIKRRGRCKCLLPKTRKLPALIGKTFGKKLVLSHVGKNSAGTNLWLVRCECGREKIMRSDSVKTTMSCGCSHSNYSHRHTSNSNGRASPEYHSWSSMKQRCYSIKHHAYHRYGGRGILVCDRWLNSFENFLADMGRRPSKNHTLDRYPNNDGNYEPGNCRWATWKEQASNRRPRAAKTSPT